jgi:hypothetical protein
MDNDQAHVANQAASRRPYEKADESRLYVRVLNLSNAPLT